jgi:uncharacterized protein (TIGR02246 family)
MSFIGPIAEQVAIRALIDDYADAVFRGDAQDWGACWAEEGRWSLMGHTVTGREQIVGMWQQAMAGFGFVAFFGQHGGIAVSGNRATGRVYTHEVLQNHDGSISRPVGRYEDEYVRIDGRWLFAARTYTLLHGG